MVYLLYGVLTDQKILFSSAEPSVLAPCAQALRSLMSPLSYSSLYIPYLPTSLLSISDATTLINDSTSPYIIGVHSTLLQVSCRHAHACLPRPQRALACHASQHLRPYSGPFTRLTSQRERLLIMIKIASRHTPWLLSYHY